MHRAAIARLRADVSATLHLQVRSVEEYALMFSSVRDGDTRSLIERDAELWNAKDREGWMSAMDLRLGLRRRRPGAYRACVEQDAAEAMWNTWQQAVPG